VKINWGVVIVDVVIIVCACHCKVWALLWLLLFTGGYESKR